jgi:plasmid segregation protein ParM
MKFRDLAVDGGHGYHKAAYRDADGVLRTIAFRSVASLVTDSAASRLSSAITGPTSVKTVRVAGVAYEIDLDGDSAPTGLFAERNEIDDFPSRPEFDALLYGALLSVNATEVRNLVLGLPMHTLSKFTGLLKQKFQGRLSFGHGDCFVERVLVVPQPVGSLLTLKASGSTVFGSSTTCIVDAGHYTIDWLTTTGFKVDYSRSGGRPGGASLVYRRIAELLSAEFNERFDALDRIDLALRSRTALRAYGRAINLEQYLRQALAVTTDVVRAIRARVKSAEDLTIILTGGAAPLYLEALKSVFQGSSIVEMNESRFTNVAGFLLAGEQLR